MEDTIWDYLHTAFLCAVLFYCIRYIRNELIRRRTLKSARADFDRASQSFINATMSRYTAPMLQEMEKHEMLSIHMIETFSRVVKTSYWNESTMLVISREDASWIKHPYFAILMRDHGFRVMVIPPAIDECDNPQSFARVIDEHDKFYLFTITMSAVNDDTKKWWRFKCTTQ